MTASLSRRKIFGLAGVGVTSLALSSCGLSGNTAFGTANPSETIVVGSADFTESQIIAQIYASALNLRGLSAQTQPAIGAREAYLGALEEGTISVVPDYSGNLLLYFDAQTSATSPEEILQALPKALPSSLAVLQASPAEDKDTLVVTEQTAQKYGIRSLADLAQHQDQLSIGAPPEFSERSYGLAGMKEKYGFTPASFNPINDGGGPLTVQALLDNQVQVANIFSTDPAIAQNNFVVLDDPKNNFLAQQVIPVINAQHVSYAAAQVLDEVSALLTTDDLIHLNSRVSGQEKANPSQVAQEWVEEHFSSKKND
ncbi:ABC transporter substrate-binding protein [Rothia sp. P6271]|uniref:ABC transporter substrate-binding protein n=1 Tax=unclassified Rothia (in: high G+C Gram-positive bacteria) TaxID=2689056 RepID=UPI003AD5B573